MDYKKLLLIAVTTIVTTSLQSAVVLPGILPAQQVLAQTREAREAEAVKLLQQGLQQYRNSKIQEAIQYWQQALNISQEIGNQLKIATSLNQLGIAAFAQGEYQKAKEFHRQSLTIAREIKSREEEAKALNGLGNALTFTREYQKAIELHQKSLVIAKKISSGEEEAKSLNGLGNAYFSLNQRKKAFELYKASLAIAEKTGYKEGEAKALNNLGNTYWLQKEYEKSISLHEKALDIIRKSKDKITEAVNLQNLGSHYLFLGRYQKSIEYYQQAFTIYKEIENKEGKMQILTGLGNVYRNIQQYEKAIEYHQQSLSIAIDLGNKLGQAVSSNNLGVSNYFLGRYQKAITLYEQTLIIYKQFSLQQKLGSVLGNIGLAYSSLGDYQKSIEFYNQSLVIGREFEDKLREGNALNNIGSAYISLGQYEKASRTLLEAISVYESIRLSGLKDANKISIFDTYLRSYRLLQQAYIADNQHNNALEISERSRARAFVELLASNLAGNSQGISKIKAPTINDIRKIAMEQNTTIIQYSIIKPNLYIWVIKPTGEITFRKADLKPLWQKENTTLRQLVSTTRKSLGVGDDERSIFDVKVKNPVNEKIQQESLQKLHQLLVKPIADLLPTDPNQRVTFVPQSDLFLVPFPALMDSKGKYLIEKHTILTAPAIQVLELTRQQRERIKKLPGKNQKNALIVGNPTMPKFNTKYGEPGQKLPSLPGAKREAQAIAPLFNTTALTGDEATETTIKAKLPQAGLIHLATHGLFDGFQGLQSSIALAPSSQDNGLLTASEILDIKLNADLVVLSACNTGRGKITGDGVIGLSRSLFLAGTPSVLVSLWSVPDAPTAELMTDFYQNLYQKNLDKAQALRQAMLTRMKQHPNPRDWAAFTLIGEAE